MSALHKKNFTFLIFTLLFIFNFKSAPPDSSLLYPGLSVEEINAKLEEVLNSYYAEISRRIDNVFKKLVNRYTPGAAIAVIQNGKVVHEKGYGLAHIREKRKITPETSFLLASVSKQFTAMAIMILEEAGKLSYDDSIGKYFTGIPHFWNKITIHQLLTHTSGLPDRFYTIGYGEGMTNKDILEHLIEHRLLNNLPGRRYKYSNSGYNLLAMIVEKVSGKSFREFLNENIFEPLDMKNSCVYDETEPEIMNKAVGYKATRRGYRPNDFLLYTTGASGVYSSIEDLTKWDQALYTDKLVSKETIRKAFTPFSKVSWREHYGYGWRIRGTGEKKAIYHAGTLGGAVTMLFRVPDENFSIILLSNSTAIPRFSLVRRIAKMYHPGLIKEIGF